MLDYKWIIKFENIYTKVFSIQIIWKWFNHLLWYIVSLINTSSIVFRFVWTERIIAKFQRVKRWENRKIYTETSPCSGHYLTNLREKFGTSSGCYRIADIQDVLSQIYFAESDKFFRRFVAASSSEINCIR